MNTARFTPNEMLSATDLSKKTSSILTELSEHTHDKFVIVRNNQPNAVLLSLDAYESLLEGIEDLQLSKLASERLESFDPSTAVAHEDMKRKYG